MKKQLIFGCILLFSSTSYALDLGGFFVEPMITYERGDGEINYPSPLGTSDVEVAGFGVGSRLGLHLAETVFIGVDGRYSMPRVNDDATGIKTEAKAWNYGPVVGLQMPFVVGLRGWAGWIVDGAIDPNSDNGVNSNFTSGNGYRLGAGFKIGWASLNLEYQGITYDKSKVSGPGLTGNFDNRELKNNSWIMSVSVPFSL